MLPVSAPSASLYKIKTAPTQWSDLMGPDYNGKFGIANPALSGTSYMSVALLEKQFGWKFFEDIKANGGRIGKGSGQVIDDTASGELGAKSKKALTCSFAIRPNCS